MRYVAGDLLAVLTVLCERKVECPVFHKIEMCGLEVGKKLQCSLGAAAFPRRIHGPSANQISGSPHGLRTEDYTAGIHRPKPAPVIPNTSSIAADPQYEAIFEKATCFHWCDKEEIHVFQQEWGSFGSTGKSGVKGDSPASDEALGPPNMSLSLRYARPCG